MSFYAPRWFTHEDGEEQKRTILPYRRLLPLATILGAVIALIFALLGFHLGERMAAKQHAKMTMPCHQVMSSPTHAESSGIPQNNHRYTNCGTTVEEARANGCRFDPMSFSWLPAACHDQELIDHFRSLKDWQWYQDMSDKMPLDYGRVIRGEDPYAYVNREFHLYHCTYQWRKMHRAILHNGPLDSYIGNFTHTEHCEHVLTKEVLELGMDIVDVEIQRKFVGCGGQEHRNLYQPVHVADTHAGHHHPE